MGQVVGSRYELVDVVGAGAGGAVWRVWDHRDRRWLAAKVLQQVDAGTLLRFVREQGLRIPHAHLLAPLAWVADDVRVVFTMELVDGGSLETLLGDYGALPAYFVGEVARQLLSALASVHAAGVVHRDVKPGNVLFTATGTRRPYACLADFGIAVRVGEPRLTRVGSVLGTPGYIAPEQLAGADPAPSGDLYAVGVLIRQLLTGEPPSPLPETHDARAGDAGVMRPGSVDPTLWAFAARLTDPNPSSRPTASAAAAELAAMTMAPEPGSEQVEIFAQLPPLPPGWTSAGPVRQAAPRKVATRTEPPTTVTPVPAVSGDSARARRTAVVNRRPRRWATVASAAFAVAVLAVAGFLVLDNRPRDPGPPTSSESSPAASPAIPTPSNTGQTSTPNGGRATYPVVRVTFPVVRQ